MPRTMSNYRLFFRQFWRHFHSTGAVLPSGRILSAALARYVAEGSSPKLILEVGPGTGAVTQSIVGSLRPDDRLNLIELNDDFVSCLRNRFATEKAFTAASDRTEIIHGRLEDLPPEPRYDLLISGLPLNNFSVADVENILSIYHKLLKPGGTLSFFEYIAVRPARAMVCRAAERDRLRGIGRALDQLLAGREIRRECIWPNVPPAWVHHVRL